MSLSFKFLSQKRAKDKENKVKAKAAVKNPAQAEPPQPNNDFKSLSDPSLNASGPVEAGPINPLLSQSEYLPDVADNEAEREIAEKRRASGSVERIQCDLVAQLEAEEEQDLGEEDNIYENDAYEDDPLENPEMVNSFFDDNGNMVDEDENPEPEILVLEDLEGPGAMLALAVMNDEPKYFINAAALSDEEFAPELAASPAPDRKSNIPRPEPSPGSKPRGIPEKSAIPRCSKSRVPISKSFPDIIQTTILNSEEDNASMFKTPPKPNFDIPGSRKTSVEQNRGMMESLIADSLEELAVTREIRGPMNKSEMDGIMCESVMSGIGISNEKPPESWIVDFNSFSLEQEFIDQANRANSRIPVSVDRDKDKNSTSSNSNSLAFFINMDEAEAEPEQPPTTAAADPKKIFSMFVGIDKEEAKKAPSIPVVNKPLRALSTPGPENLMVKGKPCSAAALGKKNPSPNFPRTGQKINQPKERIKTAYVQEMSSSIDSDRGGAGGGGGAAGSQDGSVSNRSSLHVANYSDGSFTASCLMSSMETSSAPEDTDICQGGSCFKLGMDLLRMFQEGINTDVNISVRGRYVKAHKCILASRSQYFAAILSGNWIQKAGNTIYLDEFSYNVVQFTMYHIYSGTSEIPDSIDLIELASLTDLLGLEGLREVISQTIRQRFAHNFHRPCTGCISGVLEFFPLAINYGMDDLHRKMTKWICKHFVRIWPTKAFASLGDDLIQKCLSYSVNHLSPENLLDITLGCDQLLSTMPSVRWTEAIFSVVNQLSAACVAYIGENISQVLQSQRFLLFGKGQTWNISRIENTFLEGILLLKPDEACLCHVALTRLIELGAHAIDEVEWSTTFVDFLKMLRSEVEKFLLANASRAVLSKNWEQLGQDVRKRICTTSFLGLDKAGNKIQNKAHHAQTHNSVLAAKNTRPASSSSARSNTSRTSAKSPASAAAPMLSTKKDMKADLSPSTVETASISSSTSTTYSASETKSTKVASVRPMPSQVQQQNVYSSNKATASVPTGKAAQAKASTPTSNKAPTPTSHRTLSSQTATGLRKKPMEKEKSFDTSSSRTNSAGSQGRHSSNSNRTAPITPITPSKPINTFPSKTYGNSQRAPVPQQPPPTKPVFLTNSEKAKAVSKPPLIARGSRSNSISSEAANLSTHSRQSSLGSSSIQTTPRTPNLSQNSRYATASVPKPKSNSEKTIKPPQSPLPKSRFMTGGFSTSTQMGNMGMSNVRTTGHTVVSKSSARASKAPVAPAVTARGKRGGAGAPNNTASPEHHQLMTKSTYEMESSSNPEEPKMRTLAEIGRSSTFSKDEPTILGKMDLSMEMSMEPQ